jgi:hypothetical protein
MKKVRGIAQIQEMFSISLYPRFKIGVARIWATPEYIEYQ